MPARTPKSKVAASPTRSLQAAAKPGARLLLISGTIHILNGKDHKLVREKEYQALLERGWITVPSDRGNGIAECQVTPTGQAVAAAIQASKYKYTQLTLTFEQDHPHAA